MTDQLAAGEIVIVERAVSLTVVAMMQPDYHAVIVLSVCRVFADTEQRARELAAKVLALRATHAIRLAFALMI